MILKSTVSSLLSVLVLAVPTFSMDSKIYGDYSSTEKGFVHCKKVSLWKKKDGKTKGHLILAGYPDDVDLGDATFDVYPQRDGSLGDRLIGTFSTPKMTDLVTIETSVFSNPNLNMNAPGFVYVNSYITYKDCRPSVYFDTGMKKETGSTNNETQ